MSNHIKMSTFLLILLATQQASGFSAPKTPLSTQNLASNAQAARGLLPRISSLLLMAEESDDKESTPTVQESAEIETEASTTGLFIPGFSDQLDSASEPPSDEKPEPPKKKVEPKGEKMVSKEAAMSKVESVISEGGGTFNLSNSFANESTDKPKSPTPPASKPKTTAKATEERASKQDGPSIPTLPKISLPFQKPKRPTPPPPPPSNDDVITSAIGGALSGAALGLYTDVATDLLSDTDLPAIVPPAVLGVSIAAAAYTGANQSNFIGKLSSFIFGSPFRSIRNYFVQKVEQTVDDIKSTPSRIVKGVEDKIEETVEDIKATPERIAVAIEDKIDETVEEIKATPGKVAKGIESKVEKTVQEIEETVEEVVSLPGKKFNELSESLGVKSSKAEIPRPPPVESLPSRQKKSFLPPPDVKISLFPKNTEKQQTPPLSPPQQPQQTTSFDIPKISLPKVDVVRKEKPTTEKSKAKTPSLPKKDEMTLPSLSLPSISIPKPEQPKITSSTPPKPPKPAKKNDPYVFTEAALKEYIAKDKPTVTELDKLQEEERRRKKARDASIAEKAGALFPKKDTNNKVVPAVKSVVPKMQATAKARPKRQAAEVTIPPVKGRPTISLFGLGGGEKESKPGAPVIAKTTPSAPRGIPTISKWKFDPNDNSISGFIRGSRAFKDGEPVTTSPLIGAASSNSVVRTKTGSKYFLGDEDTSRSSSGIFGFLAGGGFSDEDKATPSTPPDSKVVDTLAVRLKAQGKRDEEKIQLAKQAKAKRAEQILARKQADDEKRRLQENKKAEQDAVRKMATDAAATKKAQQEAAREEARIKREQQAEEKRLAQESARAAAEAQRKAREEQQAFARKQAEEEKKKKIESARKQKERQALARKQAEEENRERKNQQMVEAKKQAEKIVSTSPRGATISLFGFGQKKDEMSSSTGQKGLPSIPTISQWRQERDGSISGFISGSSAFKNGEPITTSPIRGKAAGGRVVTTKSGSKYLLSENAALTPSQKTLSAQKEAAEQKKRLATQQKAKADEAKKRFEAEKRSADKKKQDQATKAKEAVGQAKRGSTISLFGLGGSDESSATSPSPVRKSPTLQLQQTKQASAKTSAPKGIPTITGWKLGTDGAISGRIIGSPNFKQGELITTSPIKNGRIESGSVVQTGSGSRYFLA